MSNKRISDKCCSSQSGLDTWLVIRVKNMLAGVECNRLHPTSNTRATTILTSELGTANMSGLAKINRSEMGN